MTESTDILKNGEQLAAQIRAARKALIIGSCMSYDFTDACGFNNFERRYWWRNATPSLMSTYKGDTINIDDVQFNKDENLAFRNDFFKPDSRRGDADWADVIVMDLFRDTYDVAILKSGAFVTCGPEYKKYNLLQKLDGAEVINFGTARHLKLWLDALPTFADIVNKKTTVLVPAYLSPAKYANNKFDMSKTINGHDVRRKNFFMYHYVNILIAKVPGLVLAPFKPWQNFSWTDHPWGDDPAHFAADNYRAALETLDVEACWAVARRSRPELRSVLQLNGEKSERALRQAVETGF